MVGRFRENHHHGHANPYCLVGLDVDFLGFFFFFSPPIFRFLELELVFSVYFMHTNIPLWMTGVKLGLGRIKC
jgi:hypothetical protein